MHLILTLWLACLTATAAPVLMNSPGSIGVRKGPGDGFLQTFFLTRGERVAVMGAEGDYSKIRVKRNGKVYGGYVLTAQLYGKVEVQEYAEDGWAFGFSPVFSMMSQASKSFLTEDEVRYTTSEYRSQTLSPMFTIQISRHDFWRLFFGSRLITYKGKAQTDVSATASEIKVEHTMFAFGLQKAWTPLKRYKLFYYGFGVEAARGANVKIRIGGRDLPTQSEDLPLYIGLHAMTGLQFMSGKSWSFSVEARYSRYFNQSATALEAGASAFYWF